MSESTFPFGAPAESELPEQEDTGGESRKPLLLVGGMVAALLLGAGAFLLIGGGGDDAELDQALPAAGPGASMPADEPQEVAVIPVASTDNVGRNPFKAQHIAPVEAAASDEPETSDSEGATQPALDATPEQEIQIVIESAPVEPTPPAAAEQPSSSPTTTPPSTQPSSQPSVKPAPVDDGMRYPITLQSIDATGAGDSGPAVQWGYREEGFQVMPGKSFGRFQHLRVVSIVREGERSGVLLQLGDGSPFYVAVDETVYVL